VFKIANKQKWKSLITEWWNEAVALICEFALAIIAILELRDTESMPCVLKVFFASLILITYFIQIYCLWHKRYRKQDYKKEQKINQINKVVFSSLYDSNSSKLQEIFRYTYGTVPKWNPIDYSENIIVYDVHEQIRSILVSIERAVIAIDPERFSDRNVSVELVYCYPRDDRSSYEGDIGKIPLDEKLVTKLKENGEGHPWKLISSGDTSGDQISILSHLSSRDSFYTLIDSCGTIFKNNKFDNETLFHRALVQKHRDGKEDSVLNIMEKLKKEQSQECFFIKDIRDWERAKDGKTKGSAIGTIINIRNDNPEEVFVKAVLTINTFGETIFCSTDEQGEVNLPTTQSADSSNLEADGKASTKRDKIKSPVVDKFGMTCADYEKEFIETILSTYSRLLETELAQMYIRHSIREGIRCRKTGRWIKDPRNSKREMPDKGFRCPCRSTQCEIDANCANCLQPEKCEGRKTS